MDPVMPAYCHKIYINIYLLANYLSPLPEVHDKWILGDAIEAVYEWMYEFHP